VSVESKDEWLEVKREVNESEVLYRYRAAINPALCFSEYPTLVSITWEFAEYDDPFKFQGSVEAHHADLETSLGGLNGEENGFLILVRTGEGVKEWLWYVKDFDDWMIKLNQSFSGKPAFPIKINPYDDPEWGTFKQLNEMSE
jgi:hypothetical protein